jgi:hypothetical protein
MKLKKQNQHGIWAMIAAPVILGMAAGGFHFSQVLYLVGWLMMFFSVDHFLFFTKRFQRREYPYLVAAAFFMILSILFLCYPLIEEYRIIYFFLSMLPLGLINMYYAKNRDERNIINDAAAILIFSISGGAAAFLNTHLFNVNIIMVIIISFLYFFGTALAVKTVIRERRNKTYHYISYGSHIIIFIVTLMWNWLLAAAFLFSMGRALYVAGKNIKPKHLGIIEIFNVVWLIIWASIYLNGYL